ncbi:hypothetical protein [Lysinibacillus odysseyi]|nr:hypothetical protein [Lysinibacillus odysseyi]
MELLLAVIIFFIVLAILWAIAKKLIKFAIIIFIFYILYQLFLNIAGGL